MAARAKDALNASIARIDGEIAALKSSIDQTARNGTVQFSKASDRIEKVEKAQAEPIARLNKLSETVDKLRAPQTTVAAATPAREVTGSVSGQPGSASTNSTSPIPNATTWWRSLRNGYVTSPATPNVRRLRSC